MTHAQGTTVRYGVAVFRSLGGESLEDFPIRMVKFAREGDVGRDRLRAVSYAGPHQVYLAEALPEIQSL